MELEKLLKCFWNRVRKKKFWIFVSFIIPAMFIGLFIHEVLGHGLTGVLLGGKLEGFSLFSNGSFAWTYISGLGQTGEGVMLLAGSLADFAASLAIAFLLIPRIRNFYLKSLCFWVGLGGAVDFPFYAIFGALGLRHYIVIGDIAEPQRAFGLLGLPTALAPIVGLLMLLILLKYYKFCTYLAI